jgi:peptidyl-prolyl cis-trans isomerase A (cyclophilin A)/peptidyl-prolyl cis-trans isomerase B (cyclophilin B)
MSLEKLTVKLVTNYGEISIEIYPQAAPITVRNFLHYVVDDFYDGIVFHRVIKSFVIQAGLFDASGTPRLNLRAPIVSEADNGLSNEKWTLSMARSDDPNSASAQFFINLNDNTSLDYAGEESPGYTVFGRVVEGRGLVENIGNLPVSTQGQFEAVPLQFVTILDIEIPSYAEDLVQLPKLEASTNREIAEVLLSTELIDVRLQRDGSWAILEDGVSFAELQGYTRLLLLDESIALDVSGAGGQAYRLYKAAFNRDPIQDDKTGLGYWIAQLDKGMSLEEVAERFIDSAEFEELYGGNLDNESFLKAVYQNVLERPPDPQGLNWWLKEMNTNLEKTRAKVLADFAESSENQSNTLELIGAGILYDPWLG